MVETVWAVRHGQRADTVADDWAERADRVHDPHLTDHGRWEAWRVGRRLAETRVEFDAIYASPFLRCVETATEICDELGATFALEPGLGEHRNDEWFDDHPELLATDEVCGRFDACTGEGEVVVHPEFPEDPDTAERRVAEATRGLVERHEQPEGAAGGDGGDHLLLVGHGLTMGGVVRGLVGSTEFVEAPLCGLTRVERRYGAESDGDWHLCFSGDTLHLRGED